MIRSYINIKNIDCYVDIYIFIGTRRTIFRRMPIIFLIIFLGPFLNLDTLLTRYVYLRNYNVYV
jgi:hypothetical protein